VINVFDIHAILRRKAIIIGLQVSVFVFHFKIEIDEMYY